MQIITLERFNELMVDASIRPRMRREVRFSQNVAPLSDEDWASTELLAVSDRSGNRGVLLFDSGKSFYAASYELTRGLVSKNGGAQPVICDFCRTWQTGSRAGSVTLSKPERDSGSITFLCCADLACSKHIRNLTSAAKTSRSQLREDMTNEERVERLRTRIEAVAAQVSLTPLEVND